MRDDYAEYTECPTCKIPLLDCDCNCPRCGKRDECQCKLSSLT
ncbi:MAG: hypothetical protein QQN40_07120 [Nitrosopumilus sp.]